MARSDGDREIVNGLDAVADLAREAVPPMTPLQRMRGFQAVAARTEARRRKRRSLFLGMSLATCGLVAAGVAALFMSPHAWRRHRATEAGASSGEASPLSYRVDNGEIGDGGYLRSFGGSGVGLLFAEGTELRLAAGARGRLTSVDGQGARFAIEQGEVEVNVVPRAGARWLIDAGPFLITVHGTTFTAAWDGEREQLDISMKRGLVSVSGPVADGKIAVRAGQRLTINVPEREVLLRPSDEADNTAAPAGDTTPAETAVAPSPAVEPSAPEAPRAVSARVPSIAPVRSPSRAAVTVRASAPARSWTAALAAGDFQAIVLEAEHRGLRRALVEAHSEDLAALADAARYLRRDDVARQALVAQRDRFPTSDRAHEAAFLLGRLTEGGAGGDVRAVGWYDRYLGEAPTGAYASEALGRKMTATEKLRGLEAARDIAREYLRRFPHGTYAGAARALSDTP